MAIPIYGQIHAVTYLIPATIGIARYSRLSRAMRILTVLTILMCVDLAAQYFAALWLGNNLFLSHFYIVIEFSMLCMIFYLSVPLKSTQNTLLMLGAAFVLIWASDLIFFFDPGEINTVTQMVDRILLIVMAVITLHAVMRDESTMLTDQAVFWVANAVILYSAGSAVIVGLGNQLMKLGLRYFDIAWHINWTLLMIANILYAKGLLCKSKP